VLQAEFRCELVGQPLVVRPSQRFPVGEDREAVLLAERLTIARDQRGRLILGRKEHPTLESMSVREIQQVRDLRALAAIRPRERALADRDQCARLCSSATPRPGPLCAEASDHAGLR